MESIMPLSVSTSGNGNGLSNLLRQTRMTKSTDDAATAGNDGSGGSNVRPIGRSSIDSTGSGTAQITAALTVYLSKLGGADGSEPEATVNTNKPEAGGLQNRSSAADLLRALDTYNPNAMRLTA
ncbi:hypothetical protein M8523_08855 [Hyphomicrobiales bacterium BP6-180914]|uniref:Uncharacterized protein n=1 Tax=Lichenifustis flavocetrariae TaxID=2949735 RepID=A0AA42CJI7_9HYPH|nr:hypothetical protein [Lichenifustis flavocetrariae]